MSLMRGQVYLSTPIKVFDAYVARIDVTHGNHILPYMLRCVVQLFSELIHGLNVLNDH